MSDDNIVDFPQDDAPPPEPEPIDIMEVLEDAQARLDAVRKGKHPGELKALEVDLLDPAVVDAAARYADHRALRVVVANLRMWPNFSKPAERIERAIVKRHAEVQAENRERIEQENQRKAAAFRRAAAEAEPPSAWPSSRRGPHPLVEASLARTGKGVRATFGNVFKAVRDDPRWGPRLSVNRLGDVVEMDGKAIQSETLIGANLTEWLADTYDIHVNPDTAKGALFAAAEIRAYHPVHAYLTKLPAWDGVPAIARIVPEVLGIKLGTTAEDKNQYDLYQKYIVKTAIASVARVMQPGCKQDTVLVFVGEQGAQKSGVLREWYGTEFFGDSPIPIGSKDAPIQVRTTWCYELAEGASLSRKTAEEVKQFVTIPSDNFRHVYQTNARFWPRHSVIAMTVNKKQFLNDETGSRRFWPVDIPPGVRIDLRKMRQIRDAVWAEALVLYRRAAAAKEADETPDASCRWWFEPEEDIARANDAAQFSVGDVWDPLVAEWLATRGPSDFTIAEALAGAVNVPKDRMSSTEEGRMRRILPRLGYRSKRARIAGGFKDVWTKIVIPPTTPPAAPPPAESTPAATPPSSHPAYPPDDMPPEPDESVAERDDGMVEDDNGNVY